MGKINTDNYPNRPFASYQDDDMFILQDNGGETYTTNVGDVKNLADSRIKLEGVQVNGSDLPISGKKVNVDISGKTDLKVIAFPFHDPEPDELQITFLKGAYVTYNGKLYEITQEHTGAWNPSHAREIDVAEMFVRAGNGGYNNGDRATCEGYMTKASGNYSHAEGRETQAVGECTHAEGRGTIANSIYQHVEGKYNVADNESKYIHIIGNGIDDNNRSNALTLDWEGNLEVSGEVEDGNGEKISDKADKVTNATSGNLAGLDANGNLTDSGVSPTEDVTVEGNPVTFDSPFEQDAKSVVVSVKPIQDLHGYDHPWSAGGGKNKCPYDNVSFTSGSTWCNLTGGAASSLLQGSQVALKAGTYYISMPTNTNIDGMQVADSNENVLVNSKNGSFTLATDETIYIRVKQEVASQPTTCKIQIEAGSSATSYEPYSNICPISGTDEVEIEVSGKNLLPKMAVGSTTKSRITYTVNSDGSINVNNTSSGYSDISIDVADALKNFEGETVFFSGNPSSNNNTNIRQAMLINGSTYFDYNEGVEITLPDKIETAIYLVAVAGTGTVASNVLFKPQIELGSTPTEFEPYVSHTTTIPLSSTLYGGEVDVTEGKVRVTKVIHKVTSLNRNNDYSFFAGLPANTKGGQYYTSELLCDRTPIGANGGRNEVYVNDSSAFRLNTYNAFSTAEDALAYFGGEFNICYTLATPIELDITPAILELLEGTNVVTTNGEKVAVTYGRSLWQDINDLKTDTEGKLDKSDVADVEGDTASRPYSVNEFMLRADGFYKVTQPIAQNASITASNTTKTTVGEVLTALLNA